MISPAATMSYDYPHPVSRTYQYKKITKPLLERKRRARINRCLDELKNIMVDALETERENISKLEKADVLELTVRHLQRLQAARPSASTANGDGVSPENRWQCGFGHCAAEACRFLSSLSGEAAERLAKHLASGLQTSRRSNSPQSLRGKRILGQSKRTQDTGMQAAICRVFQPNLLSPNLMDRIVSNVSSCVINVSDKINSEINLTNVSPITSTSSRSNKLVDEVRDNSVSTTIAATPQCRAPMSPGNDKNKITANCNAKPKNTEELKATSTATTTTTKNKSYNSQDTNTEDDEEIDVERVEERNAMWRPW